MLCMVVSVAFVLWHVIPVHTCVWVLVAVVDNDDLACIDKGCGRSGDGVGLDIDGWVGAFRRDIQDEQEGAAHYDWPDG